MNRGRRAFLTVTGLGALASGGAAAIGRLAAPLRAAGVRPPARWAMIVDTAKCLEAAGCRDCIDACHHTHNVPVVPDPRHEVKWIWKAPFGKVFPNAVDEGKLLSPDAPVMVLCNHCDNPPCVRVCPTKATWKRDDGIVMMDEHRCIGCRYCMAACPYGSRSFNWQDPRPRIASVDPRYPTRTKGVVEKCTFCEERLALGQPPACVEACREKALVFGDANDALSEVHERLRGRRSIRRRPELGTRPQVYYLIS